MNALDWISWLLVFIGGLNWGLVGAFNYDLVANIFGGGSTEGTVARIIYILVGLAAVWSLISVLSKSGGGRSNQPQ